MATASADSPLKEHPAAATATLSAVGYVLVIGTFLDVIPGRVSPDLLLPQVSLLSDAIVVVNVVNVLVIVAGQCWIHRDEVRKHVAAMVTSLGLILVFLVMYLVKTGGGGTKEFVGPVFAYYPYLAVLVIYTVLPIVSVPVVLHALILGTTYSERELRTEIPHRKVGRIVAGAWLVSLALGVVTYLLLNHVHSWEYTVTTVESAGALFTPVVGV